MTPKTVAAAAVAALALAIPVVSSSAVGASDAPKPTVVLVVPAHNEEDAIGLLFAETSKVMDSLGVEWSIIFVNDGSRDGTLAVLDDLYRRDERVSYISLSRNFGHQSALAAGLDHARGDVVITLDADLQHPPQLIGTLLDAWRQGYDVVHTRKLQTAELGRFKRFVRSVGYRAIGATANVEFIAQASDFRLLDSAVQEAVRGMPERTACPTWRRRRTAAST